MLMVIDYGGAVCSTRPSATATKAIEVRRFPVVMFTRGCRVGGDREGYERSAKRFSGAEKVSTRP